LLRERLGEGLPFAVALEAVRCRLCVYDTYASRGRPDAFSHDLMISHFGDFIRELASPWNAFSTSGRSPSMGGLFNMTRLALNGTRHVNAVSRIHAVVSSRLVADQWPEIRPEENPVGFRDQRCARAHLPTSDVGRFLRSGDRPRLAGPAARCGVLERARAGAGRAVLDDFAVSQITDARQRARNGYSANMRARA